MRFFAAFPGVGLAAALILSPAWGGVTFVDISAAANRGPQDSFDSSFPGAQDSEQKNGLAEFPSGPQTFRGIPFNLLDPAKNDQRSFVALKGWERHDFPQAVTLKGPGGGVRDLYFLQTCHWGGTASHITVAQYQVIYSNGQSQVIPLRVGREFTNFWGADDTAESYLAWSYRYKNSSMGVNLFAWKNPRPDLSIQSIIFKSLAKMPVPLLFGITASSVDLPISSVSPKPEATMTTSTQGWIPLKISDEPVASLMDWSPYLGAPAGKHGAVTVKGSSLVFADGTPARFWGTRLSSDVLDLSAGEQARLVDRLAANGFNWVEMDLGDEGSPSDGTTETSNKVSPVSGLETLLKQKGIYLCLVGADAPQKFTLSVENDPTLVSPELFNRIGAVFNPVAPQASVPIAFQNVPQLMRPSESLPAQLAFDRSFEKPVLAEWSEGWPQSYLAEAPLLLSAFAGFQNWAACVGEETDGSGQGTAMVPGMDWDSNPLLYAQWPAAALAYLRGDLQQGKIYILPASADADGSAPLTALAHQSGRGQLKTDPLLGEAKSKIAPALKSFVSDSGQINWKGNIGLLQVDAPRFQAVMGFLRHHELKGSAWELESSNWFAALSVISLTSSPIVRSNHLLLTGTTRMENSGMIYNASQTKVVSLGEGPILREPLRVLITLYRARKNAKLKIRALDVNRQPLRTPVPFHWSGCNLVLSWIPEAVYIEIYQ